MTKAINKKSGIVKDLNLLDAYEAAEYLNVGVQTFKCKIAREVGAVDIPTREHYYSLQSLKDWVETKIQQNKNNAHKN